MLQGKGGGKGGNLPPVRQLFASLSFDKLDTNKDGFVTEEELTKETFAWLDRDHDKSLDRNDLAKLPAPRHAPPPREKDAAPPASKPAKEKEKETDESGDPAKAYLEDLDADKNGKVSLAEFHLPGGWFKTADVDGDGKISKDEFLGKTTEKAKKSIRDLMNKSADEVFGELDTNKDGKIGADEWMLSAKGFEQLDANGDGSLSKEELVKGMEALKKLGAGKGKGGKKTEPGDAPPQ